MKKINQIITLSILLSATTLFSDEIPLYMFLPNITGDLVHIYPDIAYERNPSLMLQFKKKVIIPSLNTSMDNNRDEDLLDDYYLDIEKYRARKGFDISSNLSTVIFIPILGGKSVIGGRFSGYHEISEQTETTEYADLPEENNIWERSDTRYRLSGDLLFSIKLLNLDLGIIGGIYYENDPVKDSFSITTNKSKSSDSYYVDTIGYRSNKSKTETTVFNPSITIGTTIPILRGKLGLSANFSYSTKDHNTFVIADKDDDGFNESIVTIKEFMTNDEWGSGHSFFEDQDNLTNIKLTLSPDYILPITDNIELLISADWQILNLTTITEFERTESTDKNIKITELQKAYGINSFGITCGISKEIHPTFKLRIGGGYEREVTISSILEDLNEDGTSKFDDNNLDHYGEIGMSYDPDNGKIHNNSNFGINGDFEVKHIIKVIAGGKWEPVKRVSFFSSITASFDLAEKYWYVFETYDNTTWSERELENDLDLDINTIIGTAIKLTDSFTISFNGSFGSISDNFNSRDDFIPNNGDSEYMDSEYESFKDNDNYFNIQLSFLIEL